MTLDDSLGPEVEVSRDGRGWSFYDLGPLEEEDSRSRIGRYGMARKHGSKVSLRKFLRDIHDFRRGGSDLPRRFKEPQRYAEFSDDGVQARILAWSYHGIKPSKIPYK